MMRVEYVEMKPDVHHVEVIDDDGKRWRTDVRVDGDISADDGRELAYRGLVISGRLPRPAFEAVIINEFERSTPAQRRDWLPR